MDGKELSVDEIKTLASLPSLETLRATILGLLTTTQRNILGVVQASQKSLIRIVNTKFNN